MRKYVQFKTCLQSSFTVFFFLRLNHTPVAGELVISVGAVFQRGCQATESSRHGIPLVEADTAAEGVAPRGTLCALLSRHLQELPSLAGEGWGTMQKRDTEGWIEDEYYTSHPATKIMRYRMKRTEIDRDVIMQITD